jgi:glycosyltransferase involved in cell wall biosynthesis
VHVIPEGWTDRNTLWEKPANPRHTVNLGWMSPPGEIEEVNQIRRVIIRVMREFPQVRLVISGDAQVYQLFDSLPEARRLYLPPVSAEDYPYLLGQVDILMVPLHNTPYNCSLCDRRLMEAGARGIPWVASPIPSHIDWNDGGLIAATADEWHTYLRQLVLDPNLRVSLGLAGRKKTESRKIDYLAKTWFDLFVSCMQPIE